MVRRYYETIYAVISIQSPGTSHVAGFELTTHGGFRGARDHSILCEVLAAVQRRERERIGACQHRKALLNLVPREARYQQEVSPRAVLEWDRFALRAKRARNTLPSTQRSWPQMQRRKPT